MAEKTRLRVRPFQKVIERGEEQPAIRAQGVIQGRTYFFSLDDLHFEIPAVELGQDQWGPFAVIEEAERPLEGGFSLRIMPEGHEDDEELGIGPGCQIELHRPSEFLMRGAVERMTGFNPQRGMLLLPPSASVSVYFNWSGTLDGHGALIRAALEFPRPQGPH